MENEKWIEVLSLGNILYRELIGFAKRLEMLGPGGKEITLNSRVLALVPGYIFDPFTDFEKAKWKISIKDKIKSLFLSFFFLVTKVNSY